MRFAPCFLPVLLVTLALNLDAQTSPQMTFGKNRVQYHHQFDDWSVYETEHFITYWYGDARNVAQGALQCAEFDFPEIQRLLEYQPNEKIEMLVFSDITDLKQSNIEESDVLMTQPEETKVVGNKIFVHFNGDHQHLRAQVREGTAGVLLNSMLFGSNLQEIVSNAVLLNLPPWFTQGLTAYCGESWSPELDNQLRDLLLSDRIKNFDRLAKEYPRLAGHAFWHYINTHFGKSTVSNLLYLTRINRSVENGFFYVLGNGYRRTTDTMLEYYRRIYKEETTYLKNPPEDGIFTPPNKKKLPVTHIKISPDGKRIAWVTNDIGRWKVCIRETGDKTGRVIMKGGTRNALQAPDYNYPLLAWNPDNKHLTVISEQRDKLYLTDIEVNSGKKEKNALAPDYQRVFSLDYTGRNEIAFSAAVKGYSDLFLYRLSTKQTERLTNDFWDDLDASFALIEGRRTLLFSSNRLSDTLSTEKSDTILPIGTLDIFMYDLDSRSNELVRITNTPLSNERMAMGADSAGFSYLTNASGIVNRQAGKLEPFTAYTQAIIYLKDGAEARGLVMNRPMVWPLERILAKLAPLDSVLANIDSTQIDSIRFAEVIKKRPVTWNQTNYDRNILIQHSSQRAGKWVEVIKRSGKTSFFIRKTDPVARNSARYTLWREQKLIASGIPVDQSIEEYKTAEPVPIQPAPTDTIPPVNPGWLFQLPDYLSISTQSQTEPTPRLVTPDSIPTPPLTTSRPVLPVPDIARKTSAIRFYPFKITPYRLKFRTDYVTTTADNNVMFDGLQLYEGPQSRLSIPPPGILLKANFKDLLEDYVIEAGGRLPVTFNGAEYYLWLDNKKKRLDKRYILYRRVLVNNEERPTPYPPTLSPEYQTRTVSLLGQYEVRYPIDAFTSLRGSVGLREDKVRTLGSDLYSLERPDRAEQRASLRLSAVFDNTADIDLNLKTGTRAKIYADAIKRMSFNTEPEWSLQFNKGFMTVIGFDARHYQMLDRRSQIAVRMAGATSFGSEKMLYIMGGVENWILPKFNNTIQLPQDDGFAYQSPAVNIRGFNQNIRNGNSHILLNTELRVPIFKYLSNKPTLGNFWRNFQVVGFFDAGTAWQGRNPFSRDNPINVVYLEEGPDRRPPIVTMQVNYFRDPVVAGFGAGVRSQLLGMYMRADYAWGIESRVVQKPLLHIALGTDF
jgi:hypothetical protein